MRCRNHSVWTLGYNPLELGFDRLTRVVVADAGMTFDDFTEGP